MTPTSIRLALQHRCLEISTANLLSRIRGKARVLAIEHDSRTLESLLRDLDILEMRVNELKGAER